MDDTADASEAKRLYGIEFKTMADVKDMDAVILAVAHDNLKGISKDRMDSLYNPNNKSRILADIKGILNKSEYTDTDYIYWRL